MPIDIHGRALSPDAVKNVNVPGYPNAVAHGQDIYLNGFSETDPAQLLQDQVGTMNYEAAPIARLVSQVSSRMSAFTQGLKSIPITVSGRLGVQDPSFDFLGTRDAVQQNLVKSAQDWSKKPDSTDLMDLMLGASVVNGVRIPYMLPVAARIHNSLPPIGITTYYRQPNFDQ